MMFWEIMKQGDNVIVVIYNKDKHALVKHAALILN